MVSFGTSHLDTMAKTIEVLEKKWREQYPEKNGVSCIYQSDGSDKIKRTRAGI